MFELKVAEKRQQDKDRSAFTVVAGVGVATGKQRVRASTGLLKVGADVLSFISIFLSWEKVKLQREWKARGGVVWFCHISPCSWMIPTSSG
jgi:hypothetical protein